LAIQYNGGRLTVSEVFSVSPLNAVQRRLYAAALQLFADRGVTQINVSELAQAAGVARGTVYNNVPNLDDLFYEVAARLSSDMNERIAGTVREIEDPAVRLSSGIRFFVRHAHEEPHWGRFLCRFGFSSALLQEIWAGQPTKDLLEGLEKGRFHFRREQVDSVIALLVGTVMGAVFLVLEGHKTWREAGSDAAEFFLTAIGVPQAEAGAIACRDLPALPANPTY
jgi:AcrR family transcriptional regulator